MMGQPAHRGWVEVAGSGRDFRVGIASGPDDFEQAFLLLAENYQARGYEQAGTELFRFTPFHVLPDTIDVRGPGRGARSSRRSRWSPTPRCSACRWSRSSGREVDRSAARAGGWARSPAWPTAASRPREFLPVFMAP